MKITTDISLFLIKFNLIKFSAVGTGTELKRNGLRNRNVILLRTGTGHKHSLN